MLAIYCTIGFLMWRKKIKNLMKDEIIGVDE